MNAKPSIALSGLAAILGFQTNGAAAENAGATNFERDRQSILAMTGTFKVTFDFRETVPFVADYQPIPEKVTGGHEVVRVAEDTGTTIRLQHLLVVDGDGGKPMVIKHWRQDWVYQPSDVVVYREDRTWALQPVAAEARAGIWSQTVWQTDDSPRYGGIGRWAYDGGVARWQSNETLRPLARRDAVRHPVYDRYRGMNRHAITPFGWVHEQDNAKLGAKDGAQVTFVDEVGVNTYRRDTAFDIAAADRYWSKTAAYWKAVRADWQELLDRDRAISVEQEAENGSVTAPKLMELGDEIADGKKTAAAAIVEARKVILGLSTIARS